MKGVDGLPVGTLRDDQVQIRARPERSLVDERLLALWASQVEAGTRKMSVATDGCRVTWNRVCKHGHPTWLVYLHYVSPD